ncbi:MAG: hypothetical protein R3C11_16365 [Planctomycetaceae bacterium]
MTTTMKTTATRKTSPQILMMTTKKKTNHLAAAVIEAEGDLHGSDLHKKNQHWDDNRIASGKLQMRTSPGPNGKAQKSPHHAEKRFPPGKKQSRT